MSTSKAGRTRQRRDRAAAARAEAERRARVRTLRLTALVVVVAIAAVGVLYGVFRANTGTRDDADRFPYQVGTPGPGATAPGFTLQSSAGGTASLAGLRGKTVLLYFQEGLTCQPCWDQIAQLEQSASQIRAAGIDQVVSITSDPVDLIAQKVHDMGLSTPVLSDPALTVSKTYHANNFGMMGTSRDGHTFILIRPDGTIGWRADYGGAPKYTMDVPVTELLADLKAGAKP
jgi:peroxiredoxin